MQAFSVEKSILEGELQVKELFKFVEDNASDLDSYEMEVSIFSMLMMVGVSALKCYFAKKGTGDVGTELKTEDGTVYRRQSDLRGRNYHSVFGKINVPRTYYYSKGNPGITPLDVQVNFPNRCYSYLLQEWMDLFSIRDSFSESEVSLEKFLRIKVNQSRIEIVNQESSLNYDQFYEVKKLPSNEEEGEINALSFDGKGVPLIKSEAAQIKGRQGKGEKRQKKKEALVGISYTVDRNIRTPEEVAENLVYPEKVQEKKKNEKNTKDYVRAKNIRRIASVARSKEEVMSEIISYAKNRDPEHKRSWVVLMDGALHLWSLITMLLCGVNYVGILDIVHVVEYLWDVANALYDEKSDKRKQWVYDNLLLILQGRVIWVIGGLKQKLKRCSLGSSQSKALKDTVTYFENHKEWMNYDQYLKAGYPIGTGVVESTCGQVKNRMEGTGRRWSIEGAESMLLLRSVYKSSDWDEYWKFHMDLERSYHYGNFLKILGYTDDYDELGRLKKNLSSDEIALAA